MDLTYTADEREFRDELRQWLGVNLAEHRKTYPASDDELSLHPDKGFDSSLAWHRRMHAGRWIGIDWPCEYGGRGAGPFERLIFTEEMIAAGAPPGVNTIGLTMVGPAVMRHGTAEQRRRWLPPILPADEIWCQGFSEPNAGSDLANLATRAPIDGTDFIVDGQKVWTSSAHRADFCILLVRTDPAAPKHKGISCLLVDMRSPGITIRPLPQITGDSEFNEVFFESVRVPRQNLLGDLHRGWEVAITVLTYERMAVGSTVILHHYIDRVMQLAHRWNGAASSPLLRQQLAALYIEGRMLRLTGLRYLTRQLRGEPPGAESSVLKLGLSETYRHMAEIATQILGPYHQLWRGDRLAPDDGRWAFQSLFALRFGIAGGTSEIQRSIIGERLLGLPKS